MKENYPRFIVIDGPDGAGKTTIVKYMEDKLKAEGYNVVVGRGLGSGVAAEAIRRTMFGKSVSFNYEVHGALMCLIDCYETFIKPILEDKKSIILLDRYVSTFYAYQYYARSFNFAGLMLNSAFNHFNIKHPDIYLHCKVDVNEAIKRLNARGADNYLDLESIEFKVKSTEGYNQFFNDKNYFHECAPSKIVNIDCNLDLKEVFSQVETFINSEFKE